MSREKRIHNTSFCFGYIRIDSSKRRIASTKTAVEPRFFCETGSDTIYLGICAIVIEMKLLRESLNRGGLPDYKTKKTYFIWRNPYDRTYKLLCSYWTDLLEATHHAYYATPEFSGVTRHL